MFAHLRKNFKLANWLVRILFVLCYAFANWRTSLSVTSVLLQQPDVVVSVLSSLLTGVLLQFVLPLVCNLFLGFARIHFVPNAEYGLLALLFASIGCFVCGVGETVGYFLPVAAGWIAALLPVVTSLVVCFAFFKVTVKLYFNDVTAVNYAKYFAIVVFVFVLLFGVL